MAAGSVAVPQTFRWLRELPTPGQWERKVSEIGLVGSIRNEGGKEAVMKRIRLLILLGMVAVALPLGLLQGLAKATGTSGTTGHLSINQYADYDTEGTYLDVGLQVACTDPRGKGNVQVHVSQYEPETPYPRAEGDGTQLVVCDGRSRYVTVSVFGGVFDGGKAYATAALFSVSSPPPPVGESVATAARWISIRAV
jgi:hypothetical protein